MLKQLVKLAFLAAVPMSAQTWFTVIPALKQAPTMSVSLPAGTTYRFFSVNGKATIPVTTTAPVTVSDWDSGAPNPPDPDPGFPKSFQVLESAAFSVSIIDSSVKPAKTTPVPVPGLTTYLITCTGTGSIPAGSTAMTITATNCTAVKQ